MHQYDAIVLGAGGAGLMCAAVAGQRGRRVLLIDHNNEPGRKILISGGGRCNFTNTGVAADRFLSENPHFAKSALKRYRAADFIAMVDRYGIAWHEKTLGQLFCDGSARQIVALLVNECPSDLVTTHYGASIDDINHGAEGFSVRVNGLTASAPSMVIACGGPSIPKLGATTLAYDLAERFGLKLVAPRPALVPLTLANDDALFQSLSGVSARVVASCSGVDFREAALFTHKGLSGPSILQVSSYWHPGDTVDINFLAEAPADVLLQAKANQPKKRLHHVLSDLLPARLAGVLADQLGTSQDGIELGNMPDRVLRQADQRLRRWSFTPNGTEGYAKAEVTAGGIDTSELSSRSMQATKVPGLYAIGEAVDVTGWLGGYNFQWAWSSGWAAGQAL